MCSGREEPGDMKLDTGKHSLARIVDRLVKAECGLEGQCESWRRLHHLPGTFPGTLLALTRRMWQSCKKCLLWYRPGEGNHIYAGGERNTEWILPCCIHGAKNAFVCPGAYNSINDLNISASGGIKEGPKNLFFEEEQYYMLSPWL